MHHLSTSTYIPNFIEIEETFYEWTDVRTDGRTFYTHVIGSTWRSRPKNRPPVLARRAVDAKTLLNDDEVMFILDFMCTS